MTSVTELQEQTAQRLADELPKFTQRQGWEVLTELKGDIENIIQKNLQTLGIGLCVFTPTLAAGDFPDRRDADIVVSIVETAILNQSDTGTRVPGIDLAWIVDGILHNWQPTNGWAPLQFVGTTSVQSPFPSTNSWDVTFRTSAVVTVAEGTAYDLTPIEQQPLAMN